MHRAIGETLNKNWLLWGFFPAGDSEGGATKLIAVTVMILTQ